MIISCLCLSDGFGQIDSVLVQRVDALNQRSAELNQNHLDSSIALAMEAVALAERGKYPFGQAIAYDRLGFCMDRKADFQQGIEYYSRSARIKERIRQGDLAATWGEIGYAHNMLGHADSAIYYFEKGRRFGEETNDQFNIALQGMRIGKVHLDREDLAKAKSEFEESLRLGEIINDHFVKAEALNGLHSIYEILEEQNKAKTAAESYLTEAIMLEDRRLIAHGYRLVGRSQMHFGDMVGTKSSYRLAQAVSDSIQHRPAQIGARIDLGAVLLIEDSADQALAMFREAKLIASKSQIPRSMIWAEGHEALALIALNKPAEAIEQALVALDAAKQQPGYGLQVRPLKALWKASKMLGRSADALFYHERMTIVQDSINSEDFAKTTLRAELEKQFNIQLLEDSLAHANERHIRQLAYDRKIEAGKRKRNGYLFLGGALLFAAIGLWSRLRYTKRANIAIKNEKETSEELLLNILPKKVAEELKDKGAAEARLIDQVTVLFTDFKGFTAMAEQLSPEELVNDLNLYFSEFDHIMEKHGIEKIKTIGDAYMAAGGLPTPNATHATDVIKAAFEMRDVVEAGKARKISADLPYFEIRIGVHTGPVVAGIVGVKKFQYDIWGDTVNTASRMESSGKVSLVNISEATYELVRDNSEFDFTSRGKIKAKGKGAMEMYFVSRAELKKKTAYNKT